MIRENMNHLKIHLRIENQLLLYYERCIIYIIIYIVFEKSA